MVDATSSPRLRSKSSIIALVLLLALSAGWRLHSYVTTETIFSPDSLSYLNVARQLRGVTVPAGWDQKAMMPRDDQGARPPGYPLLLDLVFWIDRYRPTPEPSLNYLRRVDAVDAWHLQFLSSSENVRSVQLAQHGIGLLATALAYVIVLQWTGQVVLASATAALAVGLRPAWVTMYEPWILSEVMASTLLLVWVWIVTQMDRKSGGQHVYTVSASLVTGVLILVRPAQTFMIAIFVLTLVRLCRPIGWRRVVLMCLPGALLLATWTVRNGMIHRFWGLSSTLGINTISHFRGQPDLFGDARVRELIETYKHDKYAGAWIAQALVTRYGLSYPEASNLMVRESLRAALLHPSRFLLSVGGGIREALTPNETETALHHAHWASLRWPIVWSAWVAGYFWLHLIGLCGVCVDRRSVQVTAAAIWLSTISMPLLTGIDNTRYALPVQTVSLMTAAAAVHWVATYRRRRAPDENVCTGPESS